MISVDEAFRLILSSAADCGTETIALEQCTGRILRQDVTADRDYPPFDRVCMDGIAINFEGYQNGLRQFIAIGIQPAGSPPQKISSKKQCVEIMTGAQLPEGTDTVVQYEQLNEHKDGKNPVFGLSGTVIKGQNIHYQGKDALKGRILIKTGSRINSAMLGLMASVGLGQVIVGKLPRIAIIGSGDELVSINKKPLPYQLRQSNPMALLGIFQAYGISPQIYHVTDKMEDITQLTQELLQDSVDCLIFTGGVSAGKKDFIPQALRSSGMEQVFHKVSQRPGKPLLFGRWPDGKVAFGLPGNPVSALLNAYRYIVPWLLKSMKAAENPSLYATLVEEIHFAPKLTYFMPIKLQTSADGALYAKLCKFGGSGNFIGIAQSDGFLELPAEHSVFAQGSRLPLWLIRPL